MRLQVGGNDHQLVRLPALDREPGEDAIEDIATAPSDEPLVDRLERFVRCRRIAPTQAVADHEDDAADDPLVIHARYAVRPREIRLYPPNLLFRQPDQVTRRWRLRHP